MCAWISLMHNIKQSLIASPLEPVCARLRVENVSRLVCDKMDEEFLGTPQHVEAALCVCVNLPQGWVRTNSTCVNFELNEPLGCKYSGDFPHVSSACAQCECVLQRFEPRVLVTNTDSGARRGSRAEQSGLTGIIMRVRNLVRSLLLRFIIVILVLMRRCEIRQWRTVSFALSLH